MIKMMKIQSLQLQILAACDVKATNKGPYCINGRTENTLCLADTIYPWAKYANH